MREIILDDPISIVILKAVIIFVICLVSTIMAVWAERRIVARMQMRLGPNRVGKFGVLQGLADGVKLALKEDLIPAAADKIVFIIAPIISATTCFMAFAVIPMTGEITLFGEKTSLQLTDISVGVLYILSIASIGVYGIVLAGWSSGSTYPLLGGLRSSAQVISYEIAMGLSLVAVFLYAGSMSTIDIVNSQSSWWFAVTLFPSFAIYTISMVGECALFFLAEYVNIIGVSALATTLFLGGYHALPGLGFTESWLGGWFTFFWFFAKVLFFFFIFVWLRGTLPRLRYDQFMKFGWKVLIPANVVWIMVVAVLRYFSNQGTSRSVIIAFAGGVILLYLFASMIWERAAKNRAETAISRPIPAAPSFPIPKLPMDISTISVPKAGQERVIHE